MPYFFCSWPVCRRTSRAPSTSVDQVAASYRPSSPGSDEHQATGDGATLSTGTSQESQLAKLTLHIVTGS